MYLKNEELKNGIVLSANESNYGNISYDLRIKDILSKGENFAEYSLKPAETLCPK